MKQKITLKDKKKKVKVKCINVGSKRSKAISVTGRGGL
jgi:hypothetical protein